MKRGNMGLGLMIDGVDDADMCYISPGRGSERSEWFPLIRFLLIPTEKGLLTVHRVGNACSCCQVY